MLEAQQALVEKQKAATDSPAPATTYKAAPAAQDTCEPAEEAGDVEIWEVQACDSSCDWPCAKCKWEKCHVLSTNGRRYQLKMLEDNEVIENVLDRYMRRYVDAGEEAGGPSKRLRRGQT